ncbi:uncharacterized protein [Littorina saxatilis]|uniref:uncharacterized protein n=1 Tax=Littorina saxatilis TaxID=31220 RepID=UPI0038B606A5
MEKLQNVEQQRRVVLQWLPAHCGVHGNKKADKLAKLGAQEDQADNPVSFTEKKTLIKAACRSQKTKQTTPSASRRRRPSSRQRVGPRAQEDQADNPGSFTEKKTLLKAACMSQSTGRPSRQPRQLHGEEDPPQGSV